MHFCTTDSGYFVGFFGHGSRHSNDRMNAFRRLKFTSEGLPFGRGPTQTEGNSDHVKSIVFPETLGYSVAFPRRKAVLGHLRKCRILPKQDLYQSTTQHQPSNVI